MNDERKPRPVSGEIMTGAPSGGGTGRTGRDIVDATFETVPQTVKATAPGGAVGPRSGFATSSAPVSGLSMLDRDRDPERGGSRRGGPGFWTFGIALIVGAFWVSGGHAIVRNSSLFEAAPEAGLRLTAVTSRVDVAGDRPLLFVDGEAVNEGEADATLGDFDIVVTANDGQTTRYRLGGGGKRLGKQERFAFSSRLDVPKNGVKTVTVTFAD